MEARTMVILSFSTFSLLNISWIITKIFSESLNIQISSIAGNQLPFYYFETTNSANEKQYYQ